MLKLWLVKFSNGEEWHLFGEFNEVTDAVVEYIIATHLNLESMSFLRAYRSK